MFRVPAGSYWVPNIFLKKNLIYIYIFQGVLGTRFGSLESEKIIIGSLKSEKILSLELEKSGPYKSKPGS